MPSRRALIGAAVSFLTGLSVYFAFPTDLIREFVGESKNEPQTQTERGTTSTSDAVDDEIDPMGEWGTNVDTVDGPPEEVVKHFYDALYSADTETANELVHPSSNIAPYSRESIRNLRTYDVAVEEFTITDESDSHAIVEYQLIVIGLESVERSQRTQTLRKAGEKWRIHE